MKLVVNNRLEVLTDTVRAELQANPQLASGYLSEAEFLQMMTNPRTAGANFGKAVEEIVAARAIRDPKLSNWISHKGGPGAADFYGRNYLGGETWDLTTTSGSQMRSHIGKYPNLDVVPYYPPNMWWLKP